jgi:hypothetical protein
MRFFLATTAILSTFIVISNAQQPDPRSLPYLLQQRELAANAVANCAVQLADLAAKNSDLQSRLDLAEFNRVNGDQ